MSFSKEENSAPQSALAKAERNLWRDREPGRDKLSARNSSSKFETPQRLLGDHDSLLSATVSC